MASHLDVSSCSPKRCSFFSSILGSWIDPAVMRTHVICIDMVVVGDDCGGQFVGLVCGFIASAAIS